MTQKVELAVVEKVVGLLLQPQLLTQVWHVQQLQNILLESSFSAARLPCQMSGLTGLRSGAMCARSFSFIFIRGDRASLLYVYARTLY